MVAAQGWREGALYRLPLIVPTPSIQLANVYWQGQQRSPIAQLATNSDPRRKVILWHRRLGHIGHQGLRDVIKQVSGIDLDK